MFHVFHVSCSLECTTLIYRGSCVVFFLGGVFLLASHIVSMNFFFNFVSLSRTQLLIRPMYLRLQRFPGGLKGSRFDANKTCTAFPAFNVTEAEEDVGYLSYGGMMLGDYAKSFGR